jgi:hypothetical protein
MIQVNELRSGYCIWDDMLQKIKYVNHRVINDLASSAGPLLYSPIPLTVQWMAKLGFKWNATDKRYYIQVGNTLYLEFDTDFDCFIAPESWAGSCPWPWINIKHVHQLQNIYYWLTGEELKIRN